MLVQSRIVKRVKGRKEIELDMIIVKGWFDEEI